MSLGEYDTYAELYRPVNTPNELNEPVYSNQLIEPFWCKIRQASASEGVSDDTLNNVSRYTLTAHYLPDISDTDIVIIDEVEYTIIGLDRPYRKNTTITIERSSHGRRH